MEEKIWYKHTTKNEYIYKLENGSIVGFKDNHWTEFDESEIMGEYDVVYPIQLKSLLEQEVKNRFPLNTKLKCILSNQEFTLSDYELQYTEDKNHYLVNSTSGYFIYKNGVFSTPVIDLNKLDKQIDELLENETEESLSEHFKVNNWIQTNNRTVSFYHKDDPCVIHIIKTGFENKYMIVWEDAYEVDLGKVEFYTKEEILEKFKIDIENRFKIINS